MRKWTKRTEKGASLVEMALVLPLLVLILAGVADLGRAFHDYIVIYNASREGARVASHFPDNSLMINNATINEAQKSGISLTSGMVTIVPTLDNTAKGVPVTVTVKYPFRPILLRVLGVSVITLTARTQMIVFGYDLSS